MSSNIPTTTNAAKTGFVCKPLSQVLQDANEKCSTKSRDYLSSDDYFMATALLSAKRSKDPNTQVGAVVVDSEDRIVSIGYNGFPRKLNENEFPWSKLKDENDKNEDPINEKDFYVVHAEANAILNKNVGSLQNARLYSTHFPCNECTKLILQSEITEIIYMSDKYSEKTSYIASKRMLDAANIKYTRFIPLTPVVTLDFTELIEEELNQRLSVDGKKHKNGYRMSSKSESENSRPKPVASGCSRSGKLGSDGFKSNCKAPSTIVEPNTES